MRASISGEESAPWQGSVTFFVLLLLIGAGCGKGPERPTNLDSVNNEAQDEKFQSETQPEHRAAGAPNSLIEETSPYLLQHAYDPVNWMPWSDRAFDEARTQNKPIFLSIGYST